MAGEAGTYQLQISEQPDNFNDFIAAVNPEGELGLFLLAGHERSLLRKEGTAPVRRFRKQGTAPDRDRTM